MGTRTLAAVIAEWLLALLIIKVKPLTSVDTSVHGRPPALWAVAWPPGRRLVCPVGLLGSWCDCRLFADRTWVLPSPPTTIEKISFQTMLFTTRCCLLSSPTLCGWLNVPLAGDRPSKRVREAVCSVCVSSLFVGLPLHRPPRQLHQPSRQPSMFQQPRSLWRQKRSRKIDF